MAHRNDSRGSVLLVKAMPNDKGRPDHARAVQVKHEQAHRRVPARQRHYKQGCEPVSATVRGLAGCVARLARSDLQAGKLYCSYEQGI